MKGERRTGSSVRKVKVSERERRTERKRYKEGQRERERERAQQRKKVEHFIIRKRLSKINVFTIVGSSEQTIGVAASFICDSQTCFFLR